MLIVKQNLVDAAATEALGAQLGQQLSTAKHVICYLQGDLGAGKTTLARAILRALGHSGKVKSPTYTLIEPYELALGTVYHLDLYRLSDPEELEYIGLRDLAAQAALLLIEWPERGEGFLPAADLIIQLDYRDEGRRCCVQAKSDLAERLKL